PALGAVCGLTVLVAEDHHLYRPDSEYLAAAFPATGVAEFEESRIADLPLPVALILDLPCAGESSKQRVIGHPLGVPLDHDVLPAVPPLCTQWTGGYGDVLVGLEVAHFLLLVTCDEEEGTLVPDAA